MESLPAVPGGFPVLAVPEAWRCDVCENLIYNLDEQGYPAPGAPMPHWWSASKPAVCSLCYELGLTVLVSEYWKKLHNEWRLEEARAKDAKDRQTGKRDYLTGG